MFAEIFCYAKITPFFPGRIYQTAPKRFFVEKLYRIQLENREDYLYAFVSGEYLSASISKQYWDDIAEECIRLDKTKIMIVKDFAHSVSVTEMYEMGVNLSKFFETKFIAFIDRRGNPDINYFGQMVAENRGVNMKVFDSEEAAEKWLSAI